MTNKGTGWVPDFPDVKDYTLNNKQLQALTNQVQTDQSTESVENLTEQISQALKLLAPQLKDTSGSILTDENDENDTSKQLGDLIKKLDRKASGGLSFVSAKVQKTLKSGMYDPEILKVKKYLKMIYSGELLEVPQIIHDDYGLDQSFDKLTKTLIEDFKVNMNLPKNGLIDKQTMEALRDTYFAKQYPSYSYPEDIENLIEDIKAFKTYVDNNESFEEIESRLSNLIQNMKNCREKVKNLLKNDFENNEIQFSKFVEDWLNSADEDEGAIEQKLSNSKRLNSDEYSIKSSFDTPLSTITEVVNNTGSSIAKFTAKLKEIPHFLPQVNKSNNRYVVENINTQMPDWLFESVLKKITKNRDFYDLLKPVSPTDFQMVSSDTVMEYFSKSSYIVRQQEKAAVKLIQQLSILGINPDDSISSSMHGQALSAVAEFNKINNIQGIRYHSGHSYPSFHVYNNDVYERLISNVRKKINQLFYPIVKVIFHSVMPLGQQNNLEKAIEKGVENFNKIVEKVENKENEELKNLIINSIQKESLEIADLFKDADGANRALELESLFWGAIQDTIEMLEQHARMDTLQESVRILQKLKDENIYSSEPDVMEVVEVVVQAIEKLEPLKNYEIQTVKDSIQILKTLGEAPPQQQQSQNPCRETIGKIIKILEPKKLLSQDKKLHYDGQNVFYQELCLLLNSYLELADCPLYPSAEKRTAKGKETAVALSKKAFSEDSLLEISNANLNTNGDRDLEMDLQIPLGWELHERIVAQWTDSNQYIPIYLSLPDIVDLSLWCSSIEDQGEINSCTAQAGVALTEYFAKKAHGNYVDVSSLFLYKAARNLMHREGDTGASVRETMKAMVLFGIPPEEYWPYDEENYDKEPTSFCYSFAQNYQAIKYFRLDYAGIANDTLLIQIKAVLVAGFPCMFGFTIYTSIYEEANVEKGYIPYPDQFDKMEGGHAVVAVGYDDHRIIENADGKRSEGAILIRNSWGKDWGEGGYGWLPYDYILAGLTADWWSLLQSEWFESGKFGVGATHWKSGMGGNRQGL